MGGERSPHVIHGNWIIHGDWGKTGRVLGHSHLPAANFIHGASGTLFLPSPDFIQNPCGWFVGGSWVGRGWVVGAAGEHWVAKIDKI